MRAITRVENVGINTVARMISAAGEACAAYHDEHVRGINGHRRIECDEVWAFVYAKKRAVPNAKAAPDGAGDAWTFSAIDARSKLVTSYLVGDRDGQSAIALMDDLRNRLEDRPQISTDGLKAYVEAIEGAFGGDVDFAQVIKEYGKLPGEDNERRYSPPVCTNIEKRRVEGNPDMRQGEHVLRGAQQSNHADGQSALHSANQRIQQEPRQARGDGQPVFPPLQLLPYSQDARRDASDGGRYHRYAARHGMGGWINRRSVHKAEAPRNIQKARLNRHAILGQNSVLDWAALRSDRRLSWSGPDRLGGDAKWI